MYRKINFYRQSSKTADSQQAIPKPITPQKQNPLLCDGFRHSAPRPGGFCQGTFRISKTRWPQLKSRLW